MNGRARVLLNPNAGSPSRLRRLRRSIAGIADLETRTPRDLDELGREVCTAVNEGRERLIVAGGDGTLHHVIQGLAGSGCALGILPTGTGNDLAAALGVPPEPDHALAHALSDARRTIDLGRAGGRVFAGVAGLGIDAEVVRRVNRLGRRARGPWIYALATLRAMLTFRPPTVELTLDGSRHASRVMLAAVANSPRFGSGMRLAPAARLDDGLLNVVVVEPAAPWAMLAVLIRIHRGTHVGHRTVWTAPTRAVHLRPDRPMTLIADGEPLMPVGRDGTIVEVWPQALSVIA